MKNSTKYEKSMFSDAVHCSSLQSVARMTDERCSAAVSPLSSCCSCSTNLGIPCHHVTHLGGATIITTHQYLNVTNILLNMLPSKRIERRYCCKLVVQAQIQFYSKIVILLSVPVLSCITLRLKTFFKVQQQERMLQFNVPNYHLYDRYFLELKHSYAYQEPLFCAVI